MIILVTFYRRRLKPNGGSRVTFVKQEIVLFSVLISFVINANLFFWVSWVIEIDLIVIDFMRFDNSSKLLFLFERTSQQILKNNICRMKTVKRKTFDVFIKTDIRQELNLIDHRWIIDENYSFEFVNAERWAKQLIDK